MASRRPRSAASALAAGPARTRAAGRAACRRGRRRPGPGRTAGTRAERRGGRPGTASAAHAGRDALPRPASRPRASPGPRRGLSDRSSGRLVAAGALTKRWTTTSTPSRRTPPSRSRSAARSAWARCLHPEQVARGSSASRRANQPAALLAQRDPAGRGCPCSVRTLR